MHGVCKYRQTNGGSSRWQSQSEFHSFLVLLLHHLVAGLDLRQLFALMKQLPVGSRGPDTSARCGRTSERAEKHCNHQTQFAFHMAALDGCITAQSFHRRKTMTSNVHIHRHLR